MKRFRFKIELSLLAIGVLITLGQAKVSASVINYNYNNIIQRYESIDNNNSLNTISNKKSGLVPEIENFEGTAVGSTDITLPPQKYDPRTLGLVTTVKNQGSNEVCWDFAGLATLESYLKLHNIGTFDFSEEHLRWWATPNNGYGWNRQSLEGGPTQIVPGYFTSGSGPKLESDIPYTIGNLYGAPSNMNTAKTAIDVTDIIYLDNNITSIKNSILQNGAVETCYYDDFNYLNEDSYYYYKDVATNVNHAVAIVGWDDNYSLDNFKAGTKPTRNGAWLIKNSWGANKYEAGYLWISYEDKVILNGQNGNLNYSIKNAKLHDDNQKKYQLDEYGAISPCSFKSDGANVDNLSFVNIFDFTDDHRKLDSVMFMTENVGASYNIYYSPVVNGIPNSDITKMVLLANGKVPYSGYTTVPVNSYELPKGKGAIVVNIDDPNSGKGASIGCESTVTYVTDKKVAYTSNAKPGESFVIFGNDTIDVNADQSMTSDPKFSPKNFSIKAITTKSSSTKLSNVLVSGQDITSEINEGAYTVWLPANNNKISYDMKLATENKCASIISINGQAVEENSVDLQIPIDVSLNTNVVNIECKAEDGTIGDYTINVNICKELTNSNDFSSYITQMPDKSSKEYESSLMFLLRCYDKISVAQKSKISKSNIAYIEKVKAEEIAKNHSSNGVTISGVPWNIELKATKVGSSDSRWDSLAFKIDGNNILSLYQLEVIDKLTNEVYNEPINISIPDVVGYTNKQIVNLDESGNTNYYSPSIQNGYISFTAGNVNLIGLIDDKAIITNKVTSTDTVPNTFDSSRGISLILIFSTSIVMLIICRKKSTEMI